MEYHSSSNAYEGSHIKTTVDAWKTAQAPLASEARLLDYDDFENLGYELGQATPSDTYWIKTENVPSWIYNSSYSYWTMDPKDDESIVWIVTTNGDFYWSRAYNNYMGGKNAVRPVIVLSKSEL